MMTAPQLDKNRADMLDVLYKRSGRTCGTYTGLWQEFCRDVGGNMRDLDYADLHAACVVAIDSAYSHLAEKHAQQCIAVMRQMLLGSRWA
jgi:hypothetical protein